MRAIVQEAYGPPAVLVPRDIACPEVGAGEVLVRIHTAAIHPGDWLLMTGRPYLFRLATGLRKPRKRVPGFDFAGTVEAIGETVSEFAVGDRSVW